MSNSCATRFSLISIGAATLLAVGWNVAIATAQAQVYKPIPLQVGNPIQDAISAQDIPTGQGGFARDYIVSLSAGDQVTIMLSSNSFDTFIALLAADGSPMGENDDEPDGSTNSRLVTRITTSGNYIIRV
ncbi:MAG TPA: PPC domain-containing protein, partial [Coleofasciculaceae cyanobacterium]